jgi:hypothetical protein
MGVAVYPRLGDLLRTRNISVAELERRIEARYGLSVDRKTLYRLTSPGEVQRADLKVAGAAAAVLGVDLGDVFDVQVIPTVSDEEHPADLDPDQAQRLALLLDLQGRRTLTPSERSELHALVAEYGRRLHEWQLQEIAQQRGLSLEETRAEVAADLGEALEWWRGFQADRRRRRAAIAGTAPAARRHTKSAR